MFQIQARFHLNYSNFASDFFYDPLMCLTAQVIILLLLYKWWTTTLTVNETSPARYRVRRNWELWEASGLLSDMAVFVAVLGGGMLALMLLGLLRCRVALRAVSSCWRAACACWRSSWSCICSCCSCEVEGPEEFSCPPAERRTPDSWDSSSETKIINIHYYTYTARLYDQCKFE